MLVTEFLATCVSNFSFHYNW